MNEKFCQSCGMPMTEEGLFGLEANGEKSHDYCKYCYSDGKFTTENLTVADMVDICVPHMKAQGFTEEKAREMMNSFLPTLKRWK
jgi:hypothetical protein